MLRTSSSLRRWLKAPAFVALLFSACMGSGTLRAAMSRGIRFFDDNKRLPGAFHPGLSFSPDNMQSVDLEGTVRRIGLTNFRAGLEWRPLAGIATRLGYNSDFKGSMLAGLGLGMKFKLFGEQLSYMWLPSTNSGVVHGLTLIHRFK